MAAPKSKTSKKKTSPDALVANPGVTLNEEELSKASGGLKIEGIKGESADHKHKAEIDLLGRTVKP